jgi:phosphoglycerate dehydrogenase-like enzyme
MPHAPPLTIWCNAAFPEPAMALLRDGTRAHRLVLAGSQKINNLVGGAPDAQLEQADIALGQPDPDQVIRAPRLKWVQLDSAGYTRYDRDDVRAALRARGGILTNASSVYDDPCAQHVLAMMLAFARQLPQSLLNQQGSRGWPYADLRRNSHLLGGQTALLLGFGSIARRLAELLRPFAMTLIGTRRTPRGDEPIRVLPDSETDALLPTADHVINILPDNAATQRYFTAERFARMKATALFYNIGRGTTVDQAALIAALEGGRIAGAYLDVMDPEPLPPEHPLWRAPNCFITPHTGGGHHDEFEQIVGHFVRNLGRFERREVMADRVV